jgi:hypothetical protein
VHIGLKRSCGFRNIVLGRVNKDKSAIFFTLGISVEASSERYLGLPIVVGRITSGTFGHLGERSKSRMQRSSRMQGLSEKNLPCVSEGGATEISDPVDPYIYSISVFLLTKKVCKSLKSAMTKFWWSSSLYTRSMH